MGPHRPRAAALRAAGAIGPPHGAVAAPGRVAVPKPGLPDLPAAVEQPLGGVASEVSGGVEIHGKLGSAKREGLDAESEGGGLGPRFCLFDICFLSLC